MLIFHSLKSPCWIAVHNGSLGPWIPIIVMTFDGLNESAASRSNQKQNLTASGSSGFGKVPGWKCSCKAPARGSAAWRAFPSNRHYNADRKPDRERGYPQPIPGSAVRDRIQACHSPVCLTQRPKTFSKMLDKFPLGMSIGSEIFKPLCFNANTLITHKKMMGWL